MVKMFRFIRHFPRKHIHLMLFLLLGGMAVISMVPSTASVKDDSLFQEPSDAGNLRAPIQDFLVAPVLHGSTPIEAAPSNARSDTETPAKEAVANIAWLSKAIRNGDSLSTLFSSAGLSAAELHAIIHAGPKGKQLTRIHPGQSIEFNINDNNELQQLRYKKSLTETLLITKDLSNNTYQFEDQIRKYEVRTQRAQVTIQQSLFLDAKDAGMDDNLIMELATLFGWDIDFSLDIRGGDSFDIVYEDLYLDGKKQKNGNILAANFFSRGKRFSAIYYEKREGEGAYFTENGASVRKEFTRSPVDFARVSSRFNLRRKHPIMHTIRAHKGVDYAASRGTPIKATGDGKIVLAGRKGGYGKTVVVKHGQRYTTLYAHLNGYARGIRAGKRVRQGQVIGYVGSTGMATGPHLHYEFRINGVHRNPLTVKLPRAVPLKGEDKQRFLAQTDTLRQQLLNYASQRNIALNEL